MAKKLSSNISDAIPAAAREMWYDNLQENQKKVLSFFLDGRDTFVSLPTGSGKSLCYYILPLTNDFFHPIVEIQKYRENTDRTIIFSRSYDACARVYLYIKTKLGRESTNQVGAPELARFGFVVCFLHVRKKM